MDPDDHNLWELPYVCRCVLQPVITPPGITGVLLKLRRLHPVTLPLIPRHWRFSTLP